MNVQLTPFEQAARERIILPLDDIQFLTEADVPLSQRDKAVSIESRVRELGPVVGWFKYGMESHTRFGNDGLELIQDYACETGSMVFLDLKFMDIPNTVRGAVKAAAERGVEMVNVHAAGGYPMMRAAMKGAEAAANGNRPDVIAVTVLTSIDRMTYIHSNLPLLMRGGDLGSLPGFNFTYALDLDAERTEFLKNNRDAPFPLQTQYDILLERFEQIVQAHGLESVISDGVRHYAMITAQANLAGIVCAAKDLDAIRGSLPADFIYVTPGIESPTGKAGADQRRVLTPQKAILAGSTYLVVGRAITGFPTVEERLQGGLAVIRDAAEGLKQLPEYRHLL